MTKNAEVNKVVEDLSVDDILELIKNPTEISKATNRCVMVRKMDSLPDSIKAALEVAIADPNVANRDIVAFFANHTDLTVTYNNVTDHRNKFGCIVCLYGGSR